MEMGYKTPQQIEKRKRQNNRKPSVGRSGPFMAWDGEGVTVDGRHRYVMLCNDRGMVCEDSRGLSTETCLFELVRAAQKYGDHNHVMFGGSYDANMILCDLSYDKIKVLCENGSVHWRDWRIEYRPRKFLRITGYIPFERHERHAKLGTITLWDVIGFFQSSFVTALEAWLDTDSDKGSETVAYIQGMKQRRNVFTLSEMANMRAYCVRECELLAELMTKLRSHMRYVDIAPTRWDGAGALAATMLKNNHIKKYKGTVPPAVHTASKHAYFGGRIEMVRYGNYEDTTYAHDIVSAYPSAMLNLPCLAHGEWIQQTMDWAAAAMPSGPGWGLPFAIFHVRWDIGRIDLPFYPLPHRNKQGQVFFPPTGEGWYWTPEINSLSDYVARFGGRVEMNECWYWDQTCECKPFGFIPAVFEYRQKLKRRQHNGEKVLKLALNSLYGKVAQQVGGRDGNPPPYHQLEWAGYITSLTRARMLKLALVNPAAVIAFETDGLYSTALHCITEDLNRKALGDWEVSLYDGITYVQSGVYWVCDNGEWKPKYRGLNPGTIDRPMVLNRWRTGETEIEATANRFRGMMTSAVSPERFATWRQWVEEPKTIRLYPHGKRVRNRNNDGPAYRPGIGLVTTQATGGGGLSVAHKLAWEDPTVKTLEDPYYLSDQTGDESWDGQ